MNRRDVDRLIGHLYGDFQGVIRAVWRAGEAAKKERREFQVKSGEGHRSGATEGDATAQALLTDSLHSMFPSAAFLCEEDTAHAQALDKTNPKGLFSNVAYVIDPIDGTTPYASRLGDWCVGCGVMISGVLKTSVIYAPEVNGGMLVVGDRGGKVVVMDGTRVSEITVTPPPAAKSIVYVGVDTLLYPSVTAALPEIAANVRGVYVAGSGILALARVACGRAQAVIQTPQKAWDWAAAYAAVLASGNVMRFFRLKDGTRVPIEHYNFDAFCYLPKENRLGFVAGVPDLVDRIWNLLPAEGWSRQNPDIIAGRW